MEMNAKTEVNATALAAILGLTARRIQQLAQDGVIATISKGKYYLGDAVQSYVEYRANEKPLSQAENDKLNADVVIKKAKATMMAIEVKELQGKVHRSEDVAALTADLIYTIRGAFLALPGRLAVEVVEAKSAAEAAEIIRAEVYLAMEGIANYKYDPKKYEERVRERNRWDSDEWDDTDNE